MPADLSSLRISAPFGASRETVTSPRYVWKNDDRGNHQFVIIQWTHSGAGAVAFEGKTYATTAGTAFIALVPERSAYYYPVQSVEPWQFSWLNFYGELARELCGKLRKAHGPVLPLREEESAGRALAALIRQAERRSPHDVYETSAAAYAFLMEWARALSRPTRRIDPVETAMQICRTRFREPLAIKQLADEVGVTREHLTREFLRRSRISPAQYLRTLRVRAARQMLEEYGGTQAEVALRCGFPSAKAMGRAFAQKF